MDVNNNIEEIRQIAIDHHDLVSSEFVRRYEQMGQNRFASAFSYGREKMDRQIKDLLERKTARGKFLDVGSGTGQYLELAAEFGFVPLGIEPAPSMRTASISAFPDFEVIDGTATSLPISNESTDVVLAIEVLRYLDREDTTKFFEEVQRVLRPGGIVIFSMVNKYALDGFSLAYYLRRLFRKTSLIHPHCEFFTPRQVRELLSEAGFSDARTQGCMFAVLRIAYKINSRLGQIMARRLDAWDDRTSPKMTRFAGHMLCSARKPLKVQST